MADNRTMAQMLQAPIEGYEDVPNTTIKLLLFPFSLEREARLWLDKEPPRSILTWEDLVSKFINQFFPPSKTTYLRNEIINFLQKPNETFNEAWERFKDLLLQCPHHGFSELHQLDTLDNALNPNDQDALDSIAASLEDKLDIRMNRFEKSLNDMKNSFITPTAPLKAVKEVFVTCGANHSYNQCPLTRANESSTKNLIPIPNECLIVSENGSQSTNHDAEKNDYLDEFYGPFIPIHILEEERTRREHADYINRMEMLFTINPLPHPLTNDNINVEPFSLFPIPNQESKPHHEEIDVVYVTNDVLPPRNDVSNEEVDAIGDLRIDNFIQNFEHEYSESEDSDFDNPPLPLPPPEPPNKEFDFEKEISVERSVIVKLEYINARVKFDVFNDENDVLSYFMFVIYAKEFSLLFAESEDTIFDTGIYD
nr:reverse transcriptase domain-containing protein [Tanacetum cinerariifolium]